MKIGTTHLILGAFRLDKNNDRNPTNKTWDCKQFFRLPDGLKLTVEIGTKQHDPELAGKTVAYKLGDLFIDWACRVKQGTTEAFDNLIGVLTHHYIEKAYPESERYEPKHFPDGSELTLEVEPKRDTAQKAVGDKLGDLFADLACRLESATQEEIESLVGDVPQHIENAYPKIHELTPQLKES